MVIIGLKLAFYLALKQKFSVVLVEVRRADTAQSLLITQKAMRGCVDRSVTVKCWFIN